ncbi:uncharacterized protein LOC142558399 [Dermacentor variabilis]|uniref:uncharacterized protein LOC142558399 n=1 Tax=Dermacentor variabilis TaxID=34621 RepID=UPI003F5C92A2
MPAQGGDENASSRSLTVPQNLPPNGPCDPGTFSGSDNTDVEDWLQLYERVSTSNNWDPALTLANIVFYPAGTAQVWFLNHEQELTSCEVCKQNLIDLFVKPVGRRRAAQKELARRARTCTESYVTYIQGVLTLCREAGDTTSQTEEVAHILNALQSRVHTRSEETACHCRCCNVDGIDSDGLHSRPASFEDFFGFLDWLSTSIGRAPAPATAWPLLLPVVRLSMQSPTTAEWWPTRGVNAVLRDNDRMNALTTCVLLEFFLELFTYTEKEQVLAGCIHDLHPLRPISGSWIGYLHEKLSRKDPGTGPATAAASGGPPVEAVAHHAPTVNCGEVANK